MLVRHEMSLNWMPQMPRVRTDLSYDSGPLQKPVYPQFLEWPWRHLKCKSWKFKPLKSPGMWFVDFEKFWLDNGRLLVSFCRVTVNSCNTVVFSLDYLLQITVDYFVNLSACRLAVYWSVFQNVHSCPRKVLESRLILKSRKRSTWKAGARYCSAVYDVAK